MLGFVKKTTGYSKVAYIGHSMGTTTMFYLMATDYARFVEDVCIFIALAPVVRLSGTASPAVLSFGNAIRPIKRSLEQWNIYEIFTSNRFTNWVMRVGCGYIPDFCYMGLMLFADKNVQATNHKRFQVFMGHFPAGSSLYVLLHFFQIFRNR